MKDEAVEARMSELMGGVASETSPPEKIESEETPDGQLSSARR
jgi:hypothetical protein